MVKDMSTKPHGFVLILLKNYILHFCKNAEGLGKQRGQHICSANASHKWLSASLAVWGQHICSANASHKWLSASLAVWGVPNSIRSQNSFLTRKSGSFKALSRWILCTPKKTGAAKLTLQSKVLDPTALYFCLLVKVLNEMRL